MYQTRGPRDRAATHFNTLTTGSNVHADLLHRLLRVNGIDFATGIPCGVQRYVIRNLREDPDVVHVCCTRESEAVGIAAGAFVAGKRPVVYMQNSGLFAASNDIGSLLVPYRIPLLLTVSWRGCAGEDAIQHAVTGQATTRLIRSLGLPYLTITKENLATVVAQAFEWMQQRQLPFILLLRRGWCHDT